MKRETKDVILQNIKKGRKATARPLHKGEPLERIVKRIKKQKNGKD